MKLDMNRWKYDYYIEVYQWKGPNDKYPDHFCMGDRMITRTGSLGLHWYGSTPGEESAMNFDIDFKSAIDWVKDTEQQDQCAALFSKEVKRTNRILNNWD